MRSSKLETLSYFILKMLLWINTASALIEDAYAPTSIFPWLLNSRTPNSPLLKADSYGVCYIYAVQATDTCQSIARTHDVTVSDIKSWNSQTYGWKGCDYMQQGDLICLSTGSPPMPVALPSATCGPQVPGTARPSNYADLAFLNPCPSDKCCISAGTCSTSSDICSSSDCISNCGSKVTAQTTMKKATNTNAEHTMTKAEPASATKASTTIPPDEPNKWTLTAYTGNECGGDYDLIELHGAETSKCFNIRELGTQVEEVGASCRYFTNGSFSQAGCVSSPTDMVFWSFIVIGGTCTIYNEEDCDNSKGINFELQTTSGCKKEDVYHPNWGVVWASLKCSTS
ncbi:Peptidoglycan-binding Lysin subgroup [Penicillium sp. IBT 18751x]|nr:Peptidoglycan-binding Lysin subgroup [Penicillium sp. IBT 18751x]